MRGGYYVRMPNGMLGKVYFDQDEVNGRILVTRVANLKHPYEIERGGGVEAYWIPMHRLQIIKIILDL